MTTTGQFYDQTDDLTRQVFVTLVKRKAASPLQIAAELKKDAAEVTKSVQRLIELKLIEGQQATPDTRTFMATLSEEGIRLAMTMRAF